MKKFVFTLTALALMANALAQAPFRIDTSYQTYQHFDYDAWVSEDSLMKGKLPDILNVYGGNSRGSCDVLRIERVEAYIAAGTTAKRLVVQ